MKTAIDSSVLLAIFNNEPCGANWLEILIGARSEGHLLVCDIVYSELAPAFEEYSDLDRALEKMGVRYDPVAPKAAWLAGKIFGDYRKSGRPRNHLIPDFMIAAHARTQADRLAAIDRGYLRRYFSDLVLLELESGGP